MKSRASDLISADKGDWETWLDPKTAPADAQTLIRPFPAVAMDARRVDKRVNVVKNDDPDCVKSL
jgi:putative SOS response-associated peptidase YedK